MSDAKSADPTKVISERELRFPRYRLLVIEGPDTGTVLAGESDEVSVGTADANNLVLRDSTVSRHHIAITPTARGHQLRDLGSTNGTTINGVLVDRAYLAPNAVIAMGSTRLRFEPVVGDARAALSNDTRW